MTSREKNRLLKSETPNLFQNNRVTVDIPFFHKRLYDSMKEFVVFSKDFI